MQTDTRQLDEENTSGLSQLTRVGRTKVNDLYKRIGDDLGSISVPIVKRYDVF